MESPFHDLVMKVKEQDIIDGSTIGRCNYLHGMTWCSNSNYGYTLKVNYKENPKLNGYPLRSHKQWQKQYNNRTSVERYNSRLKVLKKQRYMHY